MSKLRQLAITIGIIIVTFVAGLAVFAPTIKAQGCTPGSCGCQVIECPPDCTEVNGQIVCIGGFWCTGNCGGTNNGGCPPNTHYVPSGQCLPNGTVNKKHPRIYSWMFLNPNLFTHYASRITRNS